MPPWQRRVLRRVRALAAAGQVECTAKARDEVAAAGLHPGDVLDILARCATGERVERVRSVQSSEWLYVLRPVVGVAPLYLKVVLRSGCRIISCHEDAGDEDGEATDGW